ncbi:hypothetical protein J6590_057351 [Homalodisca vitripennis]|nr:hypothetical protein J6590_057351 [Homalodisca vitripennis]
MEVTLNDHDLKIKHSPTVNGLDHLKCSELRGQFTHDQNTTFQSNRKTKRREVEGVKVLVPVLWSDALDNAVVTLQCQCRARKGNCCAWTAYATILFCHSSVTSPINITLPCCSFLTSPSGVVLKSGRSVSACKTYIGYNETRSVTSG